MRLIALLYAFVAYATAIGTVFYGIPWLANLDAAPVTIDSNPPASLSTALAVNGLLLLVFAVQHTVQARPWFKRIFNKYVHESVERASYVLLSNVAFVLMYIYWVPVEGYVWRVEGGLAVVLWGLFGFGWVVAVFAILIKNHFHFLGLRQAWLYFSQEKITQEKLRRSFVYSIVRHPMYLGFLLAYWTTPEMSIGHFIFAAGMTVYTLVGIQFEERMLIHYIGDEYRDYKRRVPMLIPFTKHRLKGRVP